MKRSHLLGVVLREERKKKGLTLKNLGDAAGVSRQRVSDWESGRHYPQPKTLHKLGKVLEWDGLVMVKLTDLYFEDRKINALRKIEEEKKQAQLIKWKLNAIYQKVSSDYADN